MAAIHQQEKKERRGKWFIAIAMLLGISVFASSWMGLMAWMSASAAHASFVRVEDKWVPDIESEVLNFPDLTRISRVYTSDGTLLAELHDGRISEPVPFNEMPPTMVYAVLAAEDSDFFLHDGIDFQSIFSAALNNLTSDSTRGGSTITQQVVKNTFVGSEITFQRKIQEAFTALELERRYTKEQILEHYMNSIFFGSNSYGVSAASEEFFQKELNQLTVAEAATIAVLPRNPTQYNPRLNAELVLDRRNDVIAEMLDSGFITEQAAEIALAEPMVIAERQSSINEADHVVAEVKRRLLNNEEFAFLGETREERKIAIFGCSAEDLGCNGGGGLSIYLTIDLNLQNAANDILREWLPVDSDPDTQLPTGAIAMVESQNGAVRVIASGLPFEDEQFDLAVQGLRNPGSSFKPFGLVALLENGGSINSWWDSSSPIDIPCPYICSSRGNVWRVSNAGGGGSGLMRLYEATYRSVNTVYAQVSIEVGPDKIVETANRMGVTAELTPVPSIVLGAGAVSPLDMASAYTNFATNGLWSKPFLVERIEKSNGVEIYQHQHNPVQAVEPAIIAVARRPMLIVPTGSGTAPRANIGRPQGGKTGTHQNFTEAWFVGYVPQYATAVWVGYPDEQLPLTNVFIHGQTYSRVFGGSVPAPIWAQFMQVALDGVPVGEFPADPPGTGQYTVTPKTTVPDVIGEMAAGDEASIDEMAASADRAILSAHLEPVILLVPSLEPEGTVLEQAPEGGAVVQQGSEVEIRVSTGELAVAPDLTGLTELEASTALVTWEEENFTDVEFVVEHLDTSNPDEWGRVIGQSPTVGSEVEAGAIFTITVAHQPPPAEE